MATIELAKPAILPSAALGLGRRAGVPAQCPRWLIGPGPVSEAGRRRGAHRVDGEMVLTRSADGLPERRFYNAPWAPRGRTMLVSAWSRAGFRTITSIVVAQSSVGTADSGLQGYPLRTGDVRKAGAEI